MKVHHGHGLSILAGIAIGALTVSALNAQNKPPPPAYYIVEVEPTDRDAFLKEYAARVPATLQKYGGRYLAYGAVPVPFTGEPPLSRVSIIAFDNMEQLKSWHEDPERKALRPIFDRYAKGRSYGLEGAPR